MAATISGMLGRSGVDIDSPEGKQLYEDFKRRWAASLEVGNEDIGGMLGLSDDEITESFKAGFYIPVGKGKLSAGFKRDIRDSSPPGRGRRGSETSGELKVTYPFKKGGMIRNPYPYEPKTI